MRTLTLAICFLVFASCSQEPADWRRCKAGFSQLVPADSFFLVVEGVDSLSLPVPPEPVSDMNQWRSDLNALLSAHSGVDTQSLSEEQQISWVRMGRVLDSLSTGRAASLNRASKYCLDELLFHFLSDNGTIRYPGLMVRLVESIPEYYQLIEKRWSSLSKPEIQKSTEGTYNALLQLDKLHEQRDKLSIGYRERLEKALPEARFALKDYLARCQSSWLDLSLN